MIQNKHLKSHTRMNSNKRFSGVRASNSNFYLLGIFHSFFHSFRESELKEKKKGVKISQQTWNE